mmetsp:Transcript_12631/g.23973  ORF Transcript_12631/g.23973 Transcript_12631/m.23973 type:complete len:216 (+) Transcript_12631:582-1229(+)
MVRGTNTELPASGTAPSPTAGLDSSAMGAWGMMLPLQGSVLTTMELASILRLEQMRSTMHGTTLTLPATSSFSCSTALWSFSHAYNTGCSSSGSSGSWDSSGPRILGSAGPTEQVKEVAALAMSTHCALAASVSTRLPLPGSAHSSARTSSSYTTRSPPSMAAFPLMVTPTRSGRSARMGLNSSKGGCMMAKGTLPATIAGKTSPMPSRPAPKCR